MGVYGRRSIVGAISKLTIVGFLFLTIVLLAIASVIVLSLISIYTPNHGQQGYGERKY